MELESASLSGTWMSAASNSSPDTTGRIKSRDGSRNHRPSATSVISLSSSPKAENITHIPQKDSESQLEKPTPIHAYQRDAFIQKNDPNDRLLGIPKYENIYRSGRSYNYEEKYDRDQPGEEVGPDARFFKVYLDEAESYDDDMVRGFRDTIDSLLVFAALFSAVVTTFVVETSNALRPDYAQITAFLVAEQIQLLRAGGNMTAMALVPPSQLRPDSTTFSSPDIWINGLFFTSLALSLSMALLSVLVKQWLQAYTALTAGTAKERALVRHFRFQGLLKWKVHEIIGVLPLILHVSLAVFLAGLSLYVYFLHYSLSFSVIAIAGISFLFYITSMYLPAVWLDCPYRISVLYGLMRSIYLVWARARYYSRILKRDLSHHTLSIWRSVQGTGPQPTSKMFIFKPKFESLDLKAAELAEVGGSGGFVPLQNLTNAIMWLHDLSSNHAVCRIAARAVGSVQWDLNPVQYELLTDTDPRDLLRPSILRTTITCLLELPDEDITPLPGFPMDLSEGSCLLRSLYNVMRTSKRRNDDYQLVLDDGFLRACNQLAYSQKAINLPMALLYAGANVNYQPGVFNPSALQAACDGGNVSLAKVLLERGAKLYDDALQSAATFGRLEIVELLLDYGADPNEVTERPVWLVPGRTPLVNAINAFIPLHPHKTDVVRLLLDRGAMVNLEGGPDENALLAACIQGFRGIVQLILSYELNGDNIGSTKVPILIEAGFDADLFNYAASRRDGELVQIFLDQGLNVRSTFPGSEETALDLAVRQEEKGLEEFMRGWGATRTK